MATAPAVSQTHSTPNLSIPASVLPQVAPSTYLLSHLISAAAARPSGRTPFQTRPVDLNTASLTNANGSALVRLGNTSILCGVRAEILDTRDIANYRPLNGHRGVKRKRDVTGSTAHGLSPSGVDFAEDSSDENNFEVVQHSLIVPNIELQTGASPQPAYQASSGAPSALAQSLTHRILSTIRSTNLIRANDLRIYGPDISSIEEGSAADDIPDILRGYYVLYIDILVLSHDGSIFDAAFMALLAALRNTILPKAVFDNDRDQIICSSDLQQFKRLNLKRASPVALSWKVFVDTEEEKGRPWILLDPDAFEEDSGACSEGGTIIVDNTNDNETKILKLEKNGGPSLRTDVLEAIVMAASKRWIEWRKTLAKADATAMPT